MSNFKVQLRDKSGKFISRPATVSLKYSPVALKENAMGLFANIYGYGNAGKYRNRFYALQDTNTGLDTYSRELLVRWCREVTAQLPIVKTSINTLTDFAVGDAYFPEYKGKNIEWGKRAVDWLVTQYYPRCCVRGYNYPFQKSLGIIADTIMTDGDILQIHGQDKYKFPMFQLIPNNRIHSSKDNYIIEDGEYKGCMVADAVVYTMSGEAVGFCVQNSQNLVNTVINSGEEIIFSVKDSNLVGYFDFIDKNRGLPRVGYAMLQALSLQELDSYLMDKIKIESLVGLIEATPDGQAPVELQNTLTQLLAQSNTEGNSLQISPQDHALEIKQGPDIRYVKANGGDIKTLSSNTPGDQTQNYMTRLEQQVCLSLGVPHQIIYSLNQVGGRITSSPAEIFRRTVKKQQDIIDRVAKKTIGIALAKAMQMGMIETNEEDMMTECFDFTHPSAFSLDAKYDADIVLNNLDNGVISMNTATQALCNMSANEVMDAQEAEQITFYKKCQNVSKETGIDLNIVIANWKKTSINTTNTLTTPVDDQTKNTNENK